MTGLAAEKAREIEAGLASSMVSQIRQLPCITSDIAKQLSDALAESGYDEAGKAAILDAIDVGLTSSNTIKPCQMKRKTMRVRIFVVQPAVRDRFLHAH